MSNEFDHQTRRVTGHFGCGRFCRSKHGSADGGGVRQPGRQRHQSRFGGAPAEDARRGPGGSPKAEGEVAGDSLAPRGNLLFAEHACAHGRRFRQADESHYLFRGGRRGGRYQWWHQALSDVAAVSRRHHDGASARRTEDRSALRERAAADMARYPNFDLGFTVFRRMVARTLSARSARPAGPTRAAASSTPCTARCGATSTTPSPERTPRAT